MSMDVNYAIGQQILKRLFVAEERRIISDLEQLVKDDQEIQKHQRGGFMFNGKAYRIKDAVTTHKRLYTLHLSLWPKMEVIMGDLKKVKLDRDMIKQLLVKLIENTGHTGHPLQDLRDAIPECVIDAMSPEVRAYSRTREPTYFLKHPRDWKEYEELLPTIQFYSAARLIY